MMVFACVNKACFIFLQAMGKALKSTILSMVREIVSACTEKDTDRETEQLTEDTLDKIEKEGHE
jgi:hypothetical protein